MRILLSNDDGVDSRGLAALRRELGRIGEVWVVAPKREQSTTGQSMSLHRPLRVKRIDRRIFAVSGFPADCVIMGIAELLPKKPDVVVSGINRGANMGQDVFYSGTLGAAREACFRGVPAYAVSVCTDPRRPPPDENVHYDTAARTFRRVIERIPPRTLPPLTLLNLNVPDVPSARLKGIRFTRQGFRDYACRVLKRRDHRDRDYFWVGGRFRGHRGGRGTDSYETDGGYASLSPLGMDTTDGLFLERLGNEHPAWNGAVTGRRKKGR